MVAGRLGADVQARADLRVRKTLAQESQHLVLALGQQSEGLRSRSRGSAELAEQRSGSIGQLDRSGRFGSIERDASLTRRDFGFGFLQSAGQLDPSASRFDRHLERSEARDRGSQDLRRGPVS